MTKMNTELKIGDLAMIIGHQQPENDWVVGKVVTVEGFIPQYEAIPPQYCRKQPLIIASNALVIVSGVNTSPNLIDNHAILKPEHLMPLPPLPEEVLEQEKELCYD